MLSLAFCLSVCASASSAAGEQPLVTRIVVAGTINPAVADFIGESIQHSQEMNTRALIIQLDTPGGLLNSTREIVKQILAAPVPVIVYVAPGGASAASAGMFVTLSAHVAAMAPGTNIGAAHPVGAGGEEVKGVMGEKLENFVASYGEAIARRRGRNVEWAIKAVRESAAIDAVEAVKLGVVDFIAVDQEELLQKANGRRVEVNGKDVTLSLAGAQIRTLEMSRLQKVINFVADPNIAYFLLMIGILGLYLELSSPGLIFPGVLGAICLFLAAVALQLLPINYTGLGLIALGVICLIAELFVTSFGLLGIAGIICFVLGSLILFDSPGETLIVPRGIILTVAITLGAAVLGVGYLVVKSQRQKPALGLSSLVGETGEVIEKIAPSGKIRLRGEIWNAESEETIDVGETVVIVKVEGLRVWVRRV
jgi:membrane-bound serine protease (ClpP class)